MRVGMGSSNVPISSARVGTGTTNVPVSSIRVGTGTTNVLVWPLVTVENVNWAGAIGRNVTTQFYPLEIPTGQTWNVVAEGVFTSNLTMTWSGVYPQFDFGGVLSPQYQPGVQVSFSTPLTSSATYLGIRTLDAFYTIGFNGTITITKG